MCGIIGYVGPKEAQPVLVNGLKRLQYRGYDSCGIAIRMASIKVIKEVGTVEFLEKSLMDSDARSGIGHTRWATHGAVTRANAHPHLDCPGKIAVVHNGIISNFARLRSQLTAEGHVFRSETDTEVIAHLLEKYYRGKLEEAMSKTVKDLEGTFAIAAIHLDHALLVGARHEAPLVIGKTDRTGNFIASDVLAFLEHTDRVLYLEDGDVVAVSESGIDISNLGRKVVRPESQIEWDIEESRKAGYSHFMLKEIHEQPRVIDHILSGRVQTLKQGIELDISNPEKPDSVTLIACGSSYYAALLGENAISQSARIPCRAVIASEFNQADTRTPNALIIGISQSGETADTLKALRKAKDGGARILALTNVQGSTITRLADELMYLQAGPEVAVAATKSFIAQILSLYLIAFHFSVIGDSGRMEIKDGLRTLSGKVQSILDNEEPIIEQATYLSHFSNLFLIARGLNFPIALEGALKLKEVAYIHAEAFPAGELKHGPFALLNANTPVLAIVPLDSLREPMLTSIKEIKARGAPVIAITDEADGEVEQFVDAIIRVPSTKPVLNPLLNTVVLQLLAYHTARERGCPIDLPANLAKSVTVP